MQLTDKRHDTRSTAINEQHVHEVTCSGDLIAIFSQADHTCRKEHCQSQDPTDEDSCKCCNDVTSVDGHVCLFSIASHVPAHVVCYPDLLKQYEMLRYKWSLVAST